MHLSSLTQTTEGMCISLTVVTLNGLVRNHQRRFALFLFIYQVDSRCYSFQLVSFVWNTKLLGPTVLHRVKWSNSSQLYYGGKLFLC